MELRIRDHENVFTDNTYLHILSIAASLCVHCV